MQTIQDQLSALDQNYKKQIATLREQLAPQYRQIFDNLHHGDIDLGTAREQSGQSWLKATDRQQDVYEPMLYLNVLDSLQEQHVAEATIVFNRGLMNTLSSEFETNMFALLGFALSKVSVGKHDVDSVLSERQVSKFLRAKYLDSPYAISEQTIILYRSRLNARVKLVIKQATALQRTLGGVCSAMQIF